MHSTRGLGLCKVLGDWAYAQYKGTGLMHSTRGLGLLGDWACF